MNKMEYMNSNMELCKALTIVYGHSNWWNPLRSAGFQMGSIYQSPFEAYQELDAPFKRIVVSLFGREPEKQDGINDLSAPIEFIILSA